MHTSPARLDARWCLRQSCMYVVYSVLAQPIDQFSARELLHRLQTVPLAVGPPSKLVPLRQLREHAVRVLAALGLGVDVKVILTPPCIISMENHYM